MSFPFRTAGGEKCNVWDPANSMERKTLRSVLEENIRTVAFPPAEVCDCFALEFLSNLPNDK